MYQPCLSHCCYDPDVLLWHGAATIQPGRPEAFSLLWLFIVFTVTLQTKIFLCNCVPRIAAWFVLIYFSLNDKRTVGFSCCALKLVFGADVWLQGAVLQPLLVWDASAQCLYIQCSKPRGGVCGAMSEEVTSFHQGLFTKARSLACFTWFQEIGLRICELL